MINYTCDDDKEKLDFEVIYNFISSSYWAKGIPRNVMKKAIANSLCVGAYHDNQQVGFARVITDGATFGYLADVFVLAEHRGNGVSKLMMDQLIAHPELNGLRKMLLTTYDAHGLYKQYGFKPLANEKNMMEIWDPDIYQNRVDR